MNRRLRPQQTSAWEGLQQRSDRGTAHAHILAARHRERAAHPPECADPTKGAPVWREIDLSADHWRQLLTCACSISGTYIRIA